MAKVHGKVTFISLDGDDLSQYCDNSELKFEADEHDVTTYGNDGHIFLGGLTSGTVTVSGKYDSTASTGPRAVLLPLRGTVVVLIHRPEGTGASLPQDEVDVLVKSYVQTHPVADYIMWSVELTMSGDVDSAAQSA
jgi:hypothetical protein